MGLKKYFFDSYAIIEILKTNPKYIHYAEEQVTITLLNLIEIVNSVFKDLGEEQARKVYNNLKYCVEELNEDVILESTKFKNKNSKKRFSYADCIGYIFAKTNNLKFLTGDKDFEGLDNVEFVKK